MPPSSDGPEQTRDKPSTATADLLLGGCQCGEIRYAVEAAQIETLNACHCRECQRQSGSAFGLSLTAAPAGLRILQGQPRIWTRIAESGAANRAHFCPTCGVRLYHDGGEGGDWVSIKAGTLDEASRLVPVGHIWTRSALPWVPLSAELLLYERQPESYDALIAAWRDRSTLR